MVSAELNTGRRRKGSEITTALNQGATNQNSSLLTPSINSNDGADFGTSLSIWAMSDQWFWSSPLPRREILRIPGYKKHLKGILGIALIYSFPPWGMPPSFYTWERGGPGRGSRYIRVKQWAASSLNKLQWFSSFNLKPLFGCFRENKGNALCVMQEADLTFLDITFYKSCGNTEWLWEQIQKHYPKTASITNLGLPSNNSTKNQISITYKHLFLS